MRNAKKSLLMLASSLLTAALLAFWPFGSKTEVQTAVIQRGELAQSVLLSGTVQYAHEQAYVALKDGVVSSIYAQAGQPIHQGDLLLKLDTTAEENALAKLYEAEYKYDLAMNKLEETAASLAGASKLEWAANESQLLAGIEASSIRASADGVMEAIYVQEGQMVSTSELIGMSHSTGLQIAAHTYIGEIPDVRPGTAAVARKRDQEVALVLKKRSAADANTMQTFYFEATGNAELSKFFKQGEKVTVELITGVLPVSALVPLSAIDADEMVWVVENGKAYHKEIILDEFDREYASADLKWEGQSVILRPEQYELQDGMAVQVRR